MQPIAIDVARNVVCLSIFWAPVSCAKNAQSDLDAVWGSNLWVKETIIRWGLRSDESTCSCKGWQDSDAAIYRITMDIHYCVDWKHWCRRASMKVVVSLLSGGSRWIRNVLILSIGDECCEFHSVIWHWWWVILPAPVICRISFRWTRHCIEMQEHFQIICWKFGVQCMTSPFIGSYLRWSK